MSEKLIGFTERPDGFIAEVYRSVYPNGTVVYIQRYTDRNGYLVTTIGTTQCPKIIKSAAK